MSQKNYLRAELITSELREGFVKAVELLKKVAPTHKPNRVSSAFRLDVALQRFSNELRNLAAECDQWETSANKKTEDVVMAHRYLYYVLGRPVISDFEYDVLEKEVLANAGPDSPLHQPGSDSASSYSEEIIRLAKTL